MVHLHRELLKNAGQKSIIGESESTSKKIPKNNHFICFGSRYLFTRGGTCITNMKKPGFLVFHDKFDVTFDSLNTKAGG
jgi:hypothetical protein